MIKQNENINNQEEKKRRKRKLSLLDENEEKGVELGCGTVKDTVQLLTRHTLTLLL